MTIGQLISNIRVELKMLNADYRMPNKAIWFTIEKHLRWMIARELDKRSLLGYNSLFQTLKCVEVEEAPVIDECCGVRSKCIVYRTKYKLPKMYEGGGGVIIKSVFTLDGSDEISEIGVQQYMRKLENPNSKYDRTRYYYYNNGYLYFPNQRIKSIMVKAYFEDEDEVAEFGECNSKDYDPCSSKLEHDARIPDKIIGELMKFVVSDLVPQRQLPNDTQIDKNENNIR